MPKSPTVERIPNSWAIEDWPDGVYPNKAGKGRYIVRTHRSELVAAGALSRVGRDRVVLGAAYMAWLNKRTARVEGFRIAPNAGK